MIIFRCSQCKQKMQVSKAYCGKAVGCVKCGQLIRVPEPQGESGEGGEREKGGVIKFHCPSCNQKIRVGRKYAGKRARCANCKTVVRIPLVKEAAAKGPAKSEARKEEIRGGGMFEDGGGMFEMEGFGGELLEAESGKD